MKFTKRFYKDEQGWFVDLPEWPGSKAELAMVMGADKMLDIYAQDEYEVWLTFSDEPIENADVLDIINEDEIIGGAHYEVNTIRGFTFDFEVWLCDVTKYILGKMPEKIYIKG